MIPIETLKQVAVVYVHAHCPDGLASAMILKDAFRMLGTSPRIEFLAHGTPEHRRAGRDHQWPLFCDIAPDEATVLDKALHQGAVVLDHHVGARALVEAVPLGVYADAETEPGVSGAVLAFREVWMPAWQAKHPLTRGLTAEEIGGSKVPRIQDFAECIGARDTWQTSSPKFERGQWLSKLLMSRPDDYWLDHGPAITEPEVHAGRALFEAHLNAVAQAVDQCVCFLIPNEATEHNALGTRTRLQVFQEQAAGFSLTSDVAEALRQLDDHNGTMPNWERVDVVAGFAYVVDHPGDSPRVVYSLRGSCGFDVCAFAKANGGGGHKAAAGFSVLPGDMLREDPYTYLARRLREHVEAP